MGLLVGFMGLLVENMGLLVGSISSTTSTSAPYSLTK